MMTPRIPGAWVSGPGTLNTKLSPELGSREPHRVCEQERTIARAVCMGRVDGWVAGQTGHSPGLSSEAADMGDVSGAHVSVILPPVPRLYRPHASRCVSRSIKALIPSSYKTLRRREGQLLTRPTWEVETALRSGAKPVGIGPYHVFHSPWRTPTSLCSLCLSR